MKDDELDLWTRYSQGDKNAREELILYYLYLVKNQVAITSRRAPWANREDLMQEGVKGLITALSVYKRESGKDFAAYARKFIRGAVFRNPEVIRDLTRYQYENYRKARKAHDALMLEKGRKPTTEEIVERSALTADQVTNAFNATSIAFARGAPDYDPELTVTKSSIELEDERILTQEALSQIGKKAAMILIEYYWYGRSDTEIAERIGMKEDTVKKNRKRAIEKLRKQL
jgi:RNA polymerase sigma factor (sigma-70 family)